MEPTISEGLLSRFSQLIEARLGLHHPRTRWSDLERRLRRAGRELGVGEAERGLRRLLETPLDRRQLGVLAGHLTIGETYFFREPPAFEYLERVVFPDWVRGGCDRGRRPRIWVAGCSTGEEAYSIAILLQRLVPGWSAWNPPITATDVNPRALRRAEAGCYGRWSFRGAPGWVVEGYFQRQDGGRFQLLPRVREKVAFAAHNLVEDPFPEGLDLIVCRNVLIYFQREKAQEIIRGFGRSLVEGGWLILGAAEAALVPPSVLETAGRGGPACFRKGGPAAKAPGLRPATRRGQPAAAEKPPAAAPEPAGEGAAPGRPAPPAAEEGGASAGGRPAPAGGRGEEAEGQGAELYRQALASFRRARYGEAEARLGRLLGREEAGEREAAGPVRGAVPGVYADACALLARCLANQGRRQSALAWSRKAIAAGKLNPAHRYLHALILQEEGRLEAAAAALQQALYLDPDFALAHYTLGNLLLAAGKRRESVKYHRNAFDILTRRPPEEELPESEGMTAGRLAELIGAVIGEGVQP